MTFDPIPTRRKVGKKKIVLLSPFWRVQNFSCCWVVLSRESRESDGRMFLFGDTHASGVIRADSVDGDEMGALEDKAQSSGSGLENGD